MGRQDGRGTASPRTLKNLPRRDVTRRRRREQLLRDSDFTLERIAHLAGFRHPEYMNVIFKRKEGVTPGQFRDALRRGQVP